MTHILIKKVEGKNLEHYEYSKRVNEGVSLYEVEGLPIYILGEVESGMSVQRELERTAGVKLEYAEYTQDAMKRLFEYYVSKSQLLTVVFMEREGSEEAAELLEGIQMFWNTPPTPEQLSALSENFEYVQKECGDKLWHLVLRIDGKQVNVYPSSAVICPVSEELEKQVTEELLYILSGQKPKVTRLVLKEKPLEVPVSSKKSSLLTRLLDEYGEQTRIEMGLSKEEFDTLRRSILS